MANIELGFSWGPEDKTPEECAVRGVRLVNALKKLDRLFTHWCIQGKGTTFHRVDTTRAGLAQLFEKGANRTDIGRVPIREFGYGVGMTASHDDLSAAQLRMQFGGTKYGNSVDLWISPSEERAPEVFAPEFILRVVRTMIKVCRPLDGAVRSFALDRFLDNDEHRINFGWINYRAEWPLKDDVKLPAGVSRELVGDSGVLISALDRTFPNVPPGNARQLQTLFRFWKEKIETD